MRIFLKISRNFIEDESNSEKILKIIIFYYANVHFNFFIVFLGQHDRYSSNNSLDKYNYALETLKLGDSNYFNENNCMLQPKCRQPYVHNETKMKTNMMNNDSSTPKLPPRPPLPKVAQIPTTIDRDLAKQQQLSDWYYIKTGPKSPLPAIRSEKRIDVQNSANLTAVNQTTANISNFIGSGKCNEYNRINGKNNPYDGIHMSSEITKNANMPSHNVENRNKSDKQQYSGNIQVSRINIGKNERATTAPLNHPSVTFRSDDIHDMQKSSTHQYSVGEPLCKFNCYNNSEKINGCLKEQPPQENRTPLILPSSPNLTTKKLHEQQSHPFYYVEASQKHLSSPRQQKLKDLHCEHFQHVNSTVEISNSNSNIHKLTEIKPTDQCSNAMLSSFEHINVTSAFPTLSTSSSSEMTIDNKRRIQNQNYSDQQTCLTESIAGVKCRTTVSSSSYLPKAHQTKVSQSHMFFYHQRTL